MQRRRDNAWAYGPPRSEGDANMILLIDDDPTCAGPLVEALGRGGLAVLSVRTGAAALQRFARKDVDAAVVDLGLPDMDGTELITAVRGQGIWSPILVLTGRGEVAARVRSLDAGADDYMSKPAAIPELLARLRALRRRASAPRWSPLAAGKLVLGSAPGDVTLSGRPLALSPREFALLQFLLRRRCEVVTHGEILKEVFGYEFDPRTNLLAVHVSHLRRKILDAGVIIQTLRGVGFRLVDQDPAARPDSHDDP